jgi:hypothetical protein
MEENVLVSSYASLNPGTYEFNISGEGKRELSFCTAYEMIVPFPNSIPY